MDKLEKAANLVSKLKVDRPFEEPGLLLGTSAFTAAGWPERSILGSIVFQFPFFDRWKFPKPQDFLAVLAPSLKKLPTDHRFVVEIRNKNWLDARLADLLREYNVALALTDQSRMPRPHEIFEKFDPLTTDFTYVRSLGDRKGIEALTTTWEKVIVHRTAELMDWVEVLKKMIHNSKIRKIFAYANNHF